MIEEARKPAAGIIATVLSPVMMFLGATGVFAQLIAIFDSTIGVTRNPCQRDFSSRNSHNFFRDIFWLTRRTKLLRDSNPPYFFDVAQCCCPVAIIARNNDRNKLVVPVTSQ